MNSSAKDRQVVTVALCTPYLTESLEGLQNYDEVCVKTQIEEYGYDPNNLHGENIWETPNFRVKLDTPKDHEIASPEEADLVIIGSTEVSEEDVRRSRGSGTIFCRYSIFYGKPSEYTGNRPEDVGYSIDLPKHVNTVKALLVNEHFLAALMTRQEGKIRMHIERMNEYLPRPILVTPFLGQALAVQR